MIFNITRLSIEPAPLPGRIYVTLVLDEDEAAPEAYRLADLDAPGGPFWTGPAGSPASDSIVEGYLGSNP
jgi:hypothetical protein